MNNLESLLTHTFGWEVPECWECGKKMELYSLTVKEDSLWAGDGNAYFECPHHYHVRYITFVKECGIDRISKVGWSA